MLYVIASGYGHGQATVSLGTGGDRRFKADDIVLPVANLSVSGVVVDKDDKPVAGATVNAYGNKQPSLNDATTDADGNFVLKGICEGDLSISVHVGEPQRYGNAQAKGGDKDVKVVMREMRTAESRTVAAPPSLVGKPLPALDALGLKLDADALKGKMVLLCFWDVDQRPSRHCIEKLGAHLDDLAKKDVVVLAVHARPAELKKLSFPVGSLGDDAEKTLFAWGVRGLPWLILTDREHAVRFEGFTVDALDEKLKALAGAPAR
jgi:hypothetical protein